MRIMKVFGHQSLILKFKFVQAYKASQWLTVHTATATFFAPISSFSSNLLKLWLRLSCDMWPPRSMRGRVFRCPRNHPSLCPRNNEVPLTPQSGLQFPQAIHDMESPMNGVCQRMCVCVCVCVCVCDDDGSLFPHHVFNTALSCSPMEISGSLVLVLIFTVGSVCLDVLYVCVCVCPLINSPASRIIFITRTGQRGFKATHRADWTD